MGGDVLSLAAFKGGVGKSTIACNLSSLLATSGRRVLLVDADPQGNATDTFGVDPYSVRPSLGSVLSRRSSVDLASCVLPTYVDNLWICPSNFMDLAEAAEDLVSEPGGEQRIKQAIDSVRDQYHVVVIDTPPSPGRLTLGAMIASDFVVGVFEQGRHPSMGILLYRSWLADNAHLIRARLLGVVWNKYDARQKELNAYTEAVIARSGIFCFPTRIPSRAALAQAPARRGVPAALSHAETFEAFKHLVQDMDEAAEALVEPPDEFSQVLDGSEARREEMERMIAEEFSSKRTKKSEKRKRA